MDVNNEVTNDSARITYYDESYGYINVSETYTPDNPMSDAWAAVYNDTGDVIQFIIPTSLDSRIAKIRINAKYIDNNSVITVNEELEDSSTPETPDIPTDPNNALLIATDFNGAILNANTTPGYTTNSRYSSSANALQALSGTYATGLMPCTPTSTVYMKNISTEQANNYDAIYVFDMNDVDGNGVYYRTRYKFSELSGFNTVTDENGTIIQFTFPGWQAAQTHFAICSQNIGPDSIITVDTPINSN